MTTYSINVSITVMFPCEKRDSVRELQEDFFIGSAVSAYQVENPWNPQGRKTDWDVFQSRLWKRGESKICPEETGPDWFTPEKAEEDIQTVKNLGMNAQRLGVEWGRVMPEEGEVDKVALARYRQQVDFVKGLGMVPLVTLHHFSLPLWVAQQGGWESSKTVKDFAHWSEVIVNEFGDVPYFVTINELNTLGVHSFLRGYWPPEKKDILAWYRAKNNLIRANERSYETIKRSNMSAQVGISNAVTWFNPNNERSVFDKAVAAVANYVLNDDIINQTKDASDYVGMSFYTGLKLKFSPTWKFVAGDTEDSYALPESIPGYFHWATIDNLEWRDGYRRSGLIKLDPVTGERTVRESAYLLGEIASTRRIDLDYLAEKYLSPAQKEEAHRVISLMRG